MKKSRFLVVTLTAILSLVLLASVEVARSVSTYRDMSRSYLRQIESIMEEARYQYITPTNTMSFHMGSIDRLYAIVRDELRTAGIDTDLRVEVLSTSDLEPIVLMSRGGEALGEEQLSVERTIAPIILRLTVEDPHEAIMRNMRLMLLLQVGSILVIVLAFAWLLHTLYRAKQIEQIRRDLTHNITHELKTPIAAAYAATDALISIPQIAEDREQLTDYLTLARSEIKHLDSMVEHILRTSTERYRSEPLRTEELQLCTIVEEVITTMNLKYASRNVDWHTLIADDIALVADRFHLLGIINALVDNAIKYSPDTPQISLKASMDDQTVYISVADRGQGIERSEQRRIFDKFYRISTGNRHDTKGYGLGLYYVKCMVKRHGGTIAVVSRRGFGTRFDITLPRYGK